MSAELRCKNCGNAVEWVYMGKDSGGPFCGPDCEGKHATKNEGGMSAKDIQIGGNHYKDLAIQPLEYISKNGLGYCEGNAVKYLTRWRSKGGVEDLRKAIHYIELLIEQEVSGD